VLGAPACSPSNCCGPVVCVVARRPYPWGSELLAALRAVTPPAINISMQLLGTLPCGRGYSCQVTLTRGASAAGAASSSSAAAQSGAADIDSSKAWAGTQQTAPGGEPESDSRRGSTSCRLLVGCSSTDDLLLLRGLTLETFQSPMQVRVCGAFKHLSESFSGSSVSMCSQHGLFCVHVCKA
jgi:hypothetical protein